MVDGWGWLGFWRCAIGERSRKHAIARLGPRRPALAVGGPWTGSGKAWSAPGGGMGLDKARAPAAAGPSDAGAVVERSPIKYPAVIPRITPFNTRALPNTTGRQKN